MKTLEISSYLDHNTARRCTKTKTHLSFANSFTLASSLSTACLPSCRAASWPCVKPACKWRNCPSSACRSSTASFTWLPIIEQPMLRMCYLRLVRKPEPKHTNKLSPAPTRKPRQEMNSEYFEALPALSTQSTPPSALPPPGGFCVALAQRHGSALRSFGALHWILETPFSLHSPRRCKPRKHEQKYAIHGQAKQAETPRS